MTAMPMSRKTNLLPLLIAILLISLSVPSLHAIQNHGTNAWNVTQRFNQIDPDDDSYWSKECQDGRWYTFRQLANKDGKQAWDISIDYQEDGMLKNITRFTSKNANWVESKKRWCDN